MERIEGTIISFVENPRQGIAEAQGKRVFLPGANMRKELNGKCLHFDLGEQRPMPRPHLKIVMDVSPDGRGFIANNWALKKP